MGILSNLLFTQTGLGNAYNDTGTIYQDLLIDSGTLGGVESGNVPQVADTLFGSGGVVDEFTSGDGLGIEHLTADDTILGGALTGADDLFS